MVVDGYTRDQAGVVSVVLFRLTPAGTLDPTFGSGGITDAAVLGNVTEAYAVEVQGSRLVTAGYGKDDDDAAAAAAKVDLSMGGFTPAGSPDRSFGTNGVLPVDVAGDDDPGRSLAAIPDGSLLVVGSAQPTSSNLDAMVVPITPAGGLDTTSAPTAGGSTTWAGPTTPCSAWPSRPTGPGWRRSATWAGTTAARRTTEPSYGSVLARPEARP